MRLLKLTHVGTDELRAVSGQVKRWQEQGIAVVADRVGNMFRGPDGEKCLYDVDFVVQTSQTGRKADFCYHEGQKNVVGRTT